MTLFQALAMRRHYFLLSLLVLILDQVTKILAHAFLSTRGPLTIVPDLFALTYSRNPGGLFGYFSNLGQPWRLILLTALPLAAVGLIVTFLVTSGVTDRWTRVALSLILGGAVGNLIDRLFRGEVVDFLDVYRRCGEVWQTGSSSGSERRTGRRSTWQTRPSSSGPACCCSTCSDRIRSRQPETGQR